MKDKSFVYFIGDKEGVGPTKIGLTSNLDRRFKTIQAHSPGPLTIRYRIRVDASVVKEVEAHFHRYFRKQNLHGEWFTLQPSDMDYVRSYDDMVRNRNRKGKAIEVLPIIETVAKVIAVILAHAIIINRILSVIPQGT